MPIPTDTPEVAPLSANPSQSAVGSPDPNGADAGGAPVAETVQPEADLERVKQMAAEYESKREMIGNLEALRELIDGDAELKTTVLRKIQGLPADGGPARGFARVEQEIKEAFADDASTQGLSRTLKIAFEEAVNEAVSRLEPRVKAVDRMVAGSQFEKALMKHGVPSESFSTKSFQDHIQEQRANRSFRMLEESDPQYAAQIAATSWSARSGARSSADIDRRRIEAAKGGALTQRSPRGSAVVGERTKVRRGDLAAIQRHFASGLTREQLELIP